MASATWCSTDKTYTVTITSECLTAMLRQAHEAYPKETGSCLVGSYSDDGFLATVSALAPIAGDSTGTRTLFERGVDGLRDFFQKVFSSSEGRRHYVGEWHSHPNGAASPSRTDAQSTMEIARDEEALCPECLLIILAVGETWENLSVTIFSRDRGRVDLYPAENISEG